VNIAILQHTYNPTTIGWVQGLEARGHRVVIIVASEREPLGGTEHGEVVLLPYLTWTLRLGRRLLPGVSKSVYALPSPRMLRRELSGMDLVIVKVYSLRSALGALVAAGLRIPRLAWIEQVPPANREWRLLRALGVLPRRWFTALADVPGALAQEVSAGLPHIPYAPPLHPGTPPTRSSRTGPLRVLTVASFTNAVKRPAWTLEAALRAGLLDGRVELTFCGFGDHTRDRSGLGELIARTGARVQILTDVAYRDMPALYDTHDVLVLPSATEQFGMVIPEAMARGMAVVASDVVGAIGFIRHDETGLAFDAQDVDDLARQLTRLVEEPGLVERLGVAARGLVDEHASPALTAERIERLALSRSRARAGTRTRR
jgi:glycosyltransferase involved in cell wall biosynthesis